MASGSVRTSEKVRSGPRGKWDQALEAGEREKSGQKERSRALQKPPGQGGAGLWEKSGRYFLAALLHPPVFQESPHSSPHQVPPFPPFSVSSNICFLRAYSARSEQ